MWCLIYKTHQTYRRTETQSLTGNINDYDFAQVSLKHTLVESLRNRIFEMFTSTL
jgi:hypothetical protein